jgi:methylase of polypeptide subunit release factors
MVAAQERLIDETTITEPDAAPVLRSLADRLHDADFDEKNAAAAVGAPSPEQLLGHPARYAFFGGHRHPAPAPAAASVLTSLFILNQTLPAADVTAALPAALLADLRSLDLVSTTGERYRGRVSITPYRGQFFLSDQLFRSPAPHVVEPAEGTGLVMPPHTSTLLALSTVDSVEDSFLDIGCGTGFLALNAGRRVNRAAGFDLNPRCVAFATANAALNGSEARFTVADFATHQVEAQERFQAMLFNAPTIPTAQPGLSEIGQTTAEHVLNTTIEVAPRVLRPGGTAYVLGLVEVPQRLATATATVEHWLAGRTVEATVRELDTPSLTITRRELADRTLNGHSLLAFGRDQAQRLLTVLAERGVAAVVPVIISVRVAETERPTP